jgi:hypothetical protein
MKQDYALFTLCLNRIQQGTQQALRISQLTISKLSMNSSKHTFYRADQQSSEFFFHQLLNL